MKINKTIIVHLLFTVGVYIFNKIYALFSHGVSSQWMSNAYLYLLGFGVCVYSGLKILVPQIEQNKKFPGFYTIYNSGVAILLNGMLLLGIIEIAGGTSAYAVYYLYIGYGAILVAIITLIYIVLKDTLVNK